MFLMVCMYSWTALCSYCAWASIICFMARFEGVITTCFWPCNIFVVYFFLKILKSSFQDHMRKAGDVCFAEVTRDSDGALYVLTLPFIPASSRVWDIVVMSFSLHMTLS